MLRTSAERLKPFNNCGMRTSFEREAPHYRRRTWSAIEMKDRGNDDWVRYSGTGGYVGPVINHDEKSIVTIGRR
jgi:hypothetical protein